MWTSAGHESSVHFNRHFLCGDINGDGVVNILDYSYGFQYLYSSGPAPEPIMAGDVNGDCIVNIFDLTYIITYIYHSGPAPTCDHWE